MLFYNVFVAFVGLNNNTILAIQNIEFGSVSSDQYPDPAEKNIMMTAFGLKLYLYPSPPVSSFGRCGHHISILFSEWSIPRCVVVKIATGSSSSKRATILRYQTNGAPHSPKYV